MGAMACMGRRHIRHGEVYRASHPTGGASLESSGGKMDLYVRRWLLLVTGKGIRYTGDKEK